MKILIVLLVCSLAHLAISEGQQQTQLQPVQQIASQSTDTSGLQTITIPKNQQAKTQTNQQVQPLVPQTYQVGQIINGISYKVNGGVSFYQIQVKQTDKKYLFFTLVDVDHNNDIKDIGIRVFGQRNKEPIIKCDKDLLDTCYIPKGLIPQNKSLFVVVKCLDDCKFRIQAYWSSVQHLKPGDVQKFMFGQDTSQLYHVELSKYPTDFYQVRIILKPQVTRKPFDNIKIYGTYSATMPSRQSYDFISKNFWSDGQGVFLKKKDMKDLDFNIILAGQADTVYLMTCQIIEKQHHQVQLGQTISQYLSVGQTAYYHLSFTDGGEKSVLQDQYISRVSIFSGNLTFAYYTDKQMTKQYLFQPYEYMRDSELIFLKDQIASVLKSGIFVKAEAKTSDSTFMIKFFGRSEYQPIQMVENIYEFVPLKLKQSKLAYFHFGLWQPADINKQRGQFKLKFTVKFISVAGDTGVSFRVCTMGLDKCLSSDYQTASEIIKPSQQTKLNEAGFSFTIQVQKKYMAQINQVQKQGTIIIVLDGRRLDEKYNISLAAVEFLNSNQMMYLRQGRTVEDSLRYNQMKYYKYINSDPKVVSIKVHLNIISGSVQISGMRKDPRNNQGIPVSPENNILTFDKNMTDPIFIAVLGLQKSIYSLSVQIIRSNESRATSQLTVAEDIQYKIQIPSQNYQIIQVHPIFDKIILSYQSTSPIKVCPLNEDSVCTDTSVQESNQGEVQLQGKSLRSKQIVIANFNKDLIAQVTFIYHSSDSRHCQRKKLSQIYDQEVSSGTCYGFLVQELSPMEIIISRSQLLQTHVVIFMCDNYLDLPSNLQRYEIGTDLIDKACKSPTTLRQLKLFFGSGSVQGQNQRAPIKIRSVVQYQNGNIMIPEGISYNVKSISKESAIRTFVFNIVNEKFDINLLLTEIHGGFQIYADLIQEALRNTIRLTKFQANFTSQGFRDLYGRPYLTIKASDIQKHHCATCSIIMLIYSKQAVGKQVEFSMQVLTNQNSHKVLDSHQIVQDYVSNNAIKYYSYKNLNKNPQILVQVSDHNENCGTIYLSDKQFPGELNYLIKQNGNKLIYNKAQNKQYYIAYMGNKQCPYTMRVYPSDSKISTLQRGKQVLVSLNKDQVKYFLFKHFSKTAFKIICMQKFGDVKLYANRTTSQHMTQHFDKLNYKDFGIQSHQKNILYMSTQNQNFCENCYYILAVLASQNTESSLILTDIQTLAPITVDKTFYDQFQKIDQVSFFSYHRIQNLSLKPSVKSGKILVSAFYQDQQFEKQFSSNDSKSELALNFTKVAQTTSQQKNFHKNALPTFADRVINPKQTEVAQNNDDRRSQIVIRVKALQAKTLYSAVVQQLQKDSPLSGLVQKYKIQTGQPNYVQMNSFSQKTVCIQGFLRDKRQKIVFTANLDDLEHLIKIKFAIRVDGQDVTKFVTTTRTRNIIALEFKRDMYNSNIQTKAIDFQVCMNTEKPKTQDSDQGQQFTLVIMQIDNINVLLMDTQVVVQKLMNFVIHPEKAFIIDLFTCQGTSSIAYADTPKQLQKNDFSDLQIIGLAGHNHAMKIQKNSTTFVKVKGQKTIVKWMPYDFENQLGIGYIKYQVGQISYDQQFNEIKINFQSIRNIKNTSTTISQIKYQILVASNLNDIKYGTQCAHFNKEHIIVETILKETKLAPQDKINSWVLKKQKLSKFFGKDKTIYVSIVASVQLKTPQDKSSIQNKNHLQHQHYKFIYHSQQISNEFYMPNTIQKISIPNLIMIIFGVIIVLFLTTCLCTRKILPMIARIRSSNLVQEAGQGVQDYKGEKDHSGFQQLPPSSERRGIGTEDAMK